VTVLTRIGLCVGVTVALSGATNALAYATPAGAAEAVAVPASIASGCKSGDSTTALDQFLASVPADATVVFPRAGCFIINGTLLLQGTRGLTIDGNGSRLEQTESPVTEAPIVELWDDTNLTIEGLRVTGAYNGSNGGGGSECDYGIEFEADSGVTLTNDAVKDVQGDFLYLSPPYDVPTSDALSTGITITNSTFVNAGYHGLTVESVGCPTLSPCNGLTVSHDTFEGMGVDAMDFEYDDYSTPLNPDGTPYWAAQDWVTVEDNIWKNWSDDWFASVQGQTPGVQEQHLTITRNLLLSSSPLFEVVGTDPRTTTALFLDAYWTITNNRFVAGYYGMPYRGGDSVVSQLYDIAQLDFADNSFPLCNGMYEARQPPSTCTTPDEYEMDLNVVTGGQITGNNFGGAEGVVQPQPYDQNITAMTECGNGTGVAGAQVDAMCASATPQTGSTG
jgi:hypothetical protein